MSGPSLQRRIVRHSLHQERFAGFSYDKSLLTVLLQTHKAATNSTSEIFLPRTAEYMFHTQLRCFTCSAIESTGPMLNRWHSLAKMYRNILEACADKLAKETVFTARTLTAGSGGQRRNCRNVKKPDAASDYVAYHRGR